MDIALLQGVTLDPLVNFDTEQDRVYLAIPALIPVTCQNALNLVLYNYLAGCCRPPGTSPRPTVFTATNKKVDQARTAFFPQTTKDHSATMALP